MDYPLSSDRREVACRGDASSGSSGRGGAVGWPPGVPTLPDLVGGRRHLGEGGDGGRPPPRDPGEGAVRTASC